MFVQQYTTKTTQATVVFFQPKVRYSAPWLCDFVLQETHGNCKLLVVCMKMLLCVNGTCAVNGIVYKSVLQNWKRNVHTHTDLFQLAI